MWCPIAEVPQPAGGILPVDAFVKVTVDGAVGDDKLNVKLATGPAGAVMTRIVFVAVFGT